MPRCPRFRLYFYPRPPRGGRLIVRVRDDIPARFLSTPSARRATEGFFLFEGICGDFYPRPPRGGRRRAGAPTPQPARDFYPRPPRGGRPRKAEVNPAQTLFLSTPSARRATSHTTTRDLQPWAFLSTPSARRATGTDAADYILTDISIHALREEGDDLLQSSLHEIMISIHALREEGDTGELDRYSTSKAFLSTPSARRATLDNIGLPFGVKNFYPRPPRGGRPLFRNKREAA